MHLDEKSVERLLVAVVFMIAVTETAVLEAKGEIERAAAQDDNDEWVRLKGELENMGRKAN